MYRQCHLLSGFCWALSSAVWLCQGGDHKPCHLVTIQQKVFSSGSGHHMVEIQASTDLVPSGASEFTLYFLLSFWGCWEPWPFFGLKMLHSRLCLQPPVSVLANGLFLVVELFGSDKPFWSGSSLGRGWRALPLKEVVELAPPYFSLLRSFKMWLFSATPSWQDALCSPLFRNDERGLEPLTLWVIVNLFLFKSNNVQYFVTVVESWLEACVHTSLAFLS